MLHAMFCLHEKLLTTLPVLGQWRLFLLKATTTFHNYSTSACEAIIVVSFCNEILLKTALAVNRNVAFYLSVMLQLNTIVRRRLAGVLLSREDLDQRDCSSCSTWPSLHTFSFPPFRCGGRRSAERLKATKAVLRVVPALCRLSLSLCTMSFALIHVAASVLPSLCSRVRLCMSTVRALCGTISPLVSVFLDFGTSGAV